MPLLTLPNDVLHKILELFVIPLDAANTYPGTYSNPRREWVPARKALYQLTLTSRKFSRLATHFLYQSIFIFDYLQLMLLLRSLVEDEHLGTYVRSIAMLRKLEFDNLHVGVADVFEVNWRSAADAFNKVNWRSIAVAPRSQRFLSICIHDDWLDAEDVADGADRLGELAESVFALILCMTTRLQSLYMATPDCHFTQYETFMHCLDELYKVEALRSDVLTSLVEIVLVADLEISDTRMNMGVLARLMRFSDVRQLEIFGDQLYADIDTIEEVAGLEVLGNLEDIKLDGSFTLGRGWDMLCRHCPKLKLIEMFPSAYSEDFGGYATKYNLNTGFLRRADTLQSLSINTGIDEGFLEELGPDGRLSCLPHLIHLTHLTVELYVLYGHPRNLPPVLSPDHPESDHEMDLRNILPPSMKCLDIDAQWDSSALVDYWNAETRTTYAHRQTDMLVRLVEDSRPKLPHLSYVRFQNSDIFRFQADCHAANDTLLKRLTHHTRDDGTLVLSPSKSILRPGVQPVVLELTNWGKSDD
ncbi:hypothetical protein DL98DRAFT_578160 [Cadophora sp. DSE1049]|nr:hypothetical protein DL98DRAFT_578160 [Cadophora sp. DSE1049]